MELLKRVSADEFELFVPLSKINEATGEFEAWATLEEIDQSGEIIDIDKSWPYFDALSKRFSELTGGANFGPLREQHDPNKAAGHLISPPMIKQHPSGVRGIYIHGLTTDPVSHDKLVKKTLTGVSIGGRYVGEMEKVKVGDREAKKFVADPNHYGLVDSPCVKNAVVTVIKADGSESVEKVVGYVPPQGFLCRAGGFHDRKLDATACADVHEAVEKIAQRSDTSPKEGESKYGDVKYADPTNKKYPIDTEAHIRAAWNYINKPANAEKYSGKDVAAIKARIVAAWKDKIDKSGPPSADKTVGRELLEKSLYCVAQIASIIQSAQSVASQLRSEAQYEGDAADNDLADAVDQGTSQFFDALMAIAEHEYEEHQGSDDDSAGADSDDTGSGDSVGYASMAMAAVAESLRKDPNNKVNEILKSLHERSSHESKSVSEGAQNMDTTKKQEAAPAQATVTKTEDASAAFAKATEAMNKASDALQKVAETQEKHGERLTAIEKSSEGFEKSIDGMLKVVLLMSGVKVEEGAKIEDVLKAIAAKPAEPKAAARAVSKSQDSKDPETPKAEPKSTHPLATENLKPVASLPA